MHRYLLIVMSLLATESIAAQSVVSAAQVGVSQNKSAEPRVTVRFKQVPVRVAVREIVEQGGVPVTYSPQSLSADIRVSYEGVNVTLIDALKGVTRNAGVQVVKGGNGRLTLVEMQGVKLQGVITGKVTDGKTGKGVAGANISINADSRGIVTGDDGSYRLVGVGAGSHTVTVRLVGYAKQSRSVLVGEGATVVVDFKLESSASVLDQVVVTGTVTATELRAVPNAITVITAKQIEERGITRIDQLFRGDIPGLFAMERGTDATLDQITMFSRGATALSTASAGTSLGTNPIKTYVDGVELADAQYLSQIDTRSIERIEILTGPQASTIYGANAINGVMQIFTKRGSTVRPSITVNLGSGIIQNNFSSALTSLHILDGSVSGTEGKFSYNVGSGWNYMGAWTPGKQIQRRSIYGGSRYQSGSISADFSARSGWTGSKVLGSTTEMATTLSGTGKIIYVSGLVTPGKQTLYGRTVGLTLDYTPTSWWSHQINTGSDISNTETLGAAPGFTSKSDTSIDNSQGGSMRVSQSYSSTLRIPFASLAQATLTYGGDHWRSRSSSMGWTIRLSGEVANPTMTRRAAQKNTGAYVQGQVGFWDALFFTYGVRADWNPNFGERAKVRPGRYGASYAREFGIVSAKLRGSYGRSIRPPDAGLMQGKFATTNTDVYGNPYYDILSNPDLGAEFQQGTEGGLELYVGNYGSLVITRYNQTVDGLISQIFNVDSARALEPGINTACFLAQQLRPDGYCYFRQSQHLNAGSIRNQGWELQSSVNIGPLTTSGVYSWTKSRVIGITPRYRALLTNIAFTPGASFNFVPEHTWAINLSYVQQNTSLSFNINGIGSVLRLASLGELDLVTNSGVLRLSAMDAQRIGVPNNYRQSTAGYTLANMNASHKFFTNLEGTLQVTNLTNFYKNDVMIYNPAIGRQARAGLRWRWQ